MESKANKWQIIISNILIEKFYLNYKEHFKAAYFNKIEIILRNMELKAKISIK